MKIFFILLYYTLTQIRRRPNHPENFKFDLNLEAIPVDFVHADISVKGNRHFLMLSLLCRAKHLFVDGTFKVVRAPFVQLFSVHAFVHQGDTLKRIPLVYCLISGKSTRDYEAAFKALLKILSNPNIGVKTVAFGF